jgi:hypothetical protein
MVQHMRVECSCTDCPAPSALRKTNDEGSHANVRQAVKVRRLEINRRGVKVPRISRVAFVRLVGDKRQVGYGLWVKHVGFPTVGPARLSRCTLCCGERRLIAESVPFHAVVKLLLAGLDELVLACCAPCPPRRDRCGLQRRGPAVIHKYGLDSKVEQLDDPGYQPDDVGVWYRVTSACGATRVHARDRRRNRFKTEW